MRHRIVYCFVVVFASLSLGCVVSGHAHGTSHHTHHVHHVHSHHHQLGCGCQHGPTKPTMVVKPIRPKPNAVRPNPGGKPNRPMPQAKPRPEPRPQPPRREVRPPRLPVIR